MKQPYKDYSHRSFTYPERKFNSLGRTGLIQYFKATYNPHKIQDRIYEKKGILIPMLEAKRVSRHLEEQEFEEHKEFITDMVDTLLILANKYDITNVEAFAMTCYLYKATGSKSNLTKRELDGIMTKVFREANELRLTNWNKFMRILKEIS